MFRWFRTAPPAKETALAMVDPRPGDALLVIGVSEPRLAASCAAVCGLNGRAVVAGRGAGEQKLMEDAAAAAGALVEFIDAPPTMLPLDADSFNLVILPGLASTTSNGSGGSYSTMIAEAVRVLRPGGRIIAIAGQRRAGIFGALQAPPKAPAAEDVLAILNAAGTVAARRLAAVDGVSYYEARKPRP